jgi:hypothetical protein
LRYEWQNNLPLSLFSYRSREKNIPFHLDRVHPPHSRHSLFCHPPYFLSSVIVQERKLYTRHYTPFLGSPEMSGKLRYESQIILRYYTHIIHELSLERPTTTTCKTIHLERQTTPHLLSLWTTHLQYRRKYYAYSCAQ